MADALEGTSQANKGYQKVLSAARDAARPHEMRGQTKCRVDEIISWADTIRSASILLISQLSSAAEQIDALQWQLEQVRQETMIDPLTGVGSRRHRNLLLNLK
ncbi:hypothetical protein [Rhodopseudomonas sp.]|uniref:hypothetical protein n=1 Tax=Rhodopseudomonas sp. TaxID=1078 RepID=UPI0039E64C01